MKKFTFFIVFCQISYFSFSQCINGTENSQSPKDNTNDGINDGFVNTITNNFYTDEYFTFNEIVNTDTYQFISTHSGIHDYITITDTSNSLIVSGMSPLTKSNFTQSSIRVHIRTDAACNTDSFAHTLTLQDLTNAPTCYKPESPGISYKSDTRIDFYWSPPSISTPVDYDWEIVPSGNAQGDGVIVSGSTGGATTASSGNVLSPNTYYTIYIRSDCGAGGNSIYLGPLNLTTPTNSFPPPPNDLCNGAVTILEQTSIPDAASAASTAGDLVGGAGTDAGAESCGGSPLDDVWFKFVAKTTDVNVTVVPNSNVNFVVSLYSGNCGSLNYLGCSGDGSSPSPPDENIYYASLVIGQTYYVRTYYFNNTTGADRNFNIKIWSNAAATDNDNDGYVASVDCNDNDPLINPETVWYLDSDGDNYAISILTQCTSPGAGYTTSILPLTDCNDSDAGINPDTIWYLDSDGDNYAISTMTQCVSPGSGYTSVVLPLTDCDDTNSAVNPEQTEIEGNGLDDDCNPATPDLPLGIDDFNLGALKIFPNPFNSSITIHLPIGFENDRFDLTLFDLNGRRIYEKSVFSSNGEISIDNLDILQQGVYFIRIANKEEIKSVVRELIKY